MTGYSLPQYFYGGINFSRHVSIFSLFQIVKEQYLKHDSKVIFKIWCIVRYWGPLSPGGSEWRPLGIRTPVTAVKGRCPRPLDEGDTTPYFYDALLVTFHQTICVSTPLELISLGKEVIQPQVPLRLPCYDFTPVMNHKVVSALPKVKLPTSFATHSHGVTGGVYKARERIHRSILIYDY